MGSRAVVIVCRDEESARERFGVDTGEIGIVTTRTGRRFFNDPDLERGSSTGCGTRSPPPGSGRSWRPPGPASTAS